MLIRIVFASLLAASMLSEAKGAEVNISPTDPNIRYTGRWNFDDPAVPWVTWKGSSIIVKFQGTGIEIDVDTQTEQYRVVLDGVPETDRRYFIFRQTNV